jgi:hypothetical protein
MTEELEREQSPTEQNGETEAASGGIWRVFALFAVLGIVAAIGFTVARSILGSKPTDPTTERIQTLIDEANRLLKELDDKKPA